MPADESTPIEPGRALTPEPAPEPRRRVPFLKRPWIPWSLVLILVAGAAIYTTAAIIDRDEAIRGRDAARQQTEEAETGIEREEERIAEADRDRRQILTVWAGCRKTSNLVLEFLRGVENSLEQAEAGRFFATLVALDKANDAREDLLAEFRICARKASKVT